MRNLLFLLVDQFRYDMLDCVVRNESPAQLIKTPNLSRLAARGALFTQAYTPLPVCSPARQCLLTGRHPDSFGAFWNYNMLPTPPLSPDWAWTKSLHGLGYASAFIGKWDISPAASPREFGFDEYAPISEYNTYLAAKYPGHTPPPSIFESASLVDECDAKPAYLSRRAMEFIDRQQGPWVAWVDYGDPHPPCSPSAPYDAMYPPEEIAPWHGFYDTFEGKPYCHHQQAVNWGLDEYPWSKAAEYVSHYMGMISQLDTALGALIDHVDENTVIVFTSDHGDMCMDHRLFDKHYVMYQDIVRVPLILAGPGIPAVRHDELVSSCLDLPLSICDLLNLPRPEVFHGRPLSLTAPDAAPRDYICASGNGQQFGMFNTRMITDGHIKYVWNLTDTDELYDLDSDPGELINLIYSPDYAERIAELRKLLYDELKAHGDPFVRSSWLECQLLEGRKL